MARLNLEFDAEREAEEGKRRRERERVEQKARMKQAGITAATTTVVATSKTTKTRAKRDKAKGVALNVEDLAESPLRLPARTQTLSPPRQPAPVRRRRLVKKALLMESSSSSSESESGEVQDEEKDSEDDGRRTGKGRWRLTRANSSGSDSQGSRPPSPPSHAQRKDPPRQRFIPRNLLAKRRELEVSYSDDEEGMEEGRSTELSKYRYEEEGDDSFVVADSVVEFESGTDGLDFDEESEQGDGEDVKEKGKKIALEAPVWKGRWLEPGEEIESGCESEVEECDEILDDEGEEEEEEEEGEDEDVEVKEEEEADSEGDGEYEDSSSDGARAVLTYVPPTVKPVARAPILPPPRSLFTPPADLGSDSDSHAPRASLPSRTLKPSLPPHTPSRNPLVSPRKPIVLHPVTPAPPPPTSPATKRSFNKRKHALAAAFLHDLDAAVTNGALAAKTASTGGLPVVWSKTLLTTAGMFRYHWRTTPSGRRIVTDARIELAEKVCDDERRLYSTLAHEFAHAADLIVSENWSGRSHGRGFTAWLKKAKAAFPEKDIEVGACHDYEISYKYHWHCAGKGGAMGGGGGCGYVVKRHSKSVNTERHRCPGCLGRLVQVLPAPKGSGAGRGSGGEDGEKGSSEYQRFMKKRFAEIKKRNPGMQQKELMKIVGKEWRERKASNGDTNWFEETGKSGVSEVVEISDDDEDDDDDDEEYDEREKEASSRLEGVFGDLRLGTCEN